jgi:aspartate racemase
MKRIGLIGGMSWESTAEYYRLLNQGVRERLGGLHSADLVLRSFDFAAIEQLQVADDWTQAAEVLALAARELEAAGATCLLICTNTMHKVAEEVATAVNIPLLHLAEATAERILAAGFDKVGLLGTRYTMEQEFYTGRLRQAGIDVRIPGADRRAMVNRVIYEELCHGVVREASRAAFLETIDELVAGGAQAIIEGCTEIGMLVNESHTDVPLFDTTRIHAEQAVAFALDRRSP